MTDILEAAEYLSRHRELAVLELLAPFTAPVLLAGAYQGATARAFPYFDARMTVHGFEPQPWCHPLLADAPMTLHPVALGDHDGTVTLHRMGGDYASLVDTSKDGEEPTIEVQMVEAKAYLAAISPRWSLFVFNMEGYEYTLLPYLAQSGVLDTVDNLLVQFHPKAWNGPVPELPPNWVKRWDRFPAWVWWQQYR